MTTPPPHNTPGWDIDASQVIPPRISGQAIASCALGVAALLVGWFPGCGSIPGIILALVALVLGFVAFRKARRQAEANRVLPIIAMIVAMLALALSITATAILAGEILEARRQAEAAMPAGHRARRAFTGTPARVPGQAHIWRAMNAEGAAAWGFVIEASQGPDAERAADEIAKLFSSHFGEGN